MIPRGLIRSDAIRRFIEEREAEGWSFVARRDGAGHVTIEVVDARGVAVTWRIAHTPSDRVRGPLNAIAHLRRRLRERGRRVA